MSDVSDKTGGYQHRASSALGHTGDVKCAAKQEESA